MNSRTKRNISIYHLTQFLGNLDFTLPIYILFGKNYIGLNYSQIAVLTVIAFASSVAFDFLLGIFADSFSKKKSYILGVIVSFLSLLPYIFTKDYTLLILAAFLMGFGSALASNVLDTFIHEDLDDNGLIEHYAPVTSKAQQMFFFGRTFAGVLGGFLFIISPTLPYIFYAIATLICIVVASIVLTEMPSGHIKNTIAQTTKDAFTFLKKRKDIIYFCLVGLIILIFGDLQFGYYQPYFTLLHINPVYIGILYSVISLFSAFGSHLMKGFLPKYSAKTINTFMILATICTALCMLPRIPILAFIGPLFIAVTFGFVYPNLRNFLNSQSPSEIKTSVASFGTTCYAIGTMIGLSAGGVFADHFSSTIVLSIILAGSIISFVLNYLLL